MGSGVQGRAARWENLRRLQLLLRFERLSPLPGLLLRNAGVVLDGRRGVDALVESGDPGVGLEGGLVVAQELLEGHFEVHLSEFRMAVGSVAQMSAFLLLRIRIMSKGLGVSVWECMYVLL